LTLRKSNLTFYLTFLRDKYAEAAEILYDIINKVTLLDHKVSVLVACNKQDLQFAKKATSVESELEKEIEELRKVKRATQVDEVN
jgi:signal recognition particle receptor subunit beta